MFDCEDYCQYCDCEVQGRYIYGDYDLIFQCENNHETLTKYNDYIENDLDLGWRSWLDEGKY